MSRRSVVPWTANEIIYVSGQFSPQTDSPRPPGGTANIGQCVPGIKIIWPRVALQVWLDEIAYSTYLRCSMKIPPTGKFRQLPSSVASEEAELHEMDGKFVQTDANSGTVH